MFKYVDISAIDQDVKVIARPTDVLGRDAPSRARQVLEVGDVLVSTVRPNLNAVAYVGRAHGSSIASTGFCVLRPTPSDLDSRYLFHWVRTPAFVDEMVRQATGASYPAVSDKIVKNSPIPLPPIEVQRRIAAVLDAADALRAKRRQALAKLDTLTRAIFIDMFGDPTRARFPLVPLGDLVRSPIMRGIDQPGPDHHGGVPYIKTTDFGRSSLTRADLMRAAPEIAARFPRSVVETGDLVMCIRATVGPSLLVTEELAGANLSRGTARISPSDDVLPEYLFAAVNTDHFQHQIEGCLRGATFLQIPLGELRQLVIPLPSIDAQRDFVRSRMTVNAQALASERQSAKLDMMFVSLQERAFRGEL